MEEGTRTYKPKGVFRDLHVVQHCKAFRKSQKSEKSWRNFAMRAVNTDRKVATNLTLM
jgi:hypothetical protein